MFRENWNDNKVRSLLLWHCKTEKYLPLNSVQNLIDAFEGFSEGS
jgi:hypothetical protein